MQQKALTFFEKSSHRVCIVGTTRDAILVLSDYNNCSSFNIDVLQRTILYLHDNIGTVYIYIDIETLCETDIIRYNNIVIYRSRVFRLAPTAFLPIIITKLQTHTRLNDNTGNNNIILLRFCCFRRRPFSRIRSQYTYTRGHDGGGKFTAAVAFTSDLRDDDEYLSLFPMAITCASVLWPPLSRNWRVGRPHTHTHTHLNIIYIVVQVISNYSIPT